jgi:nucleoside-diphosphate-sugar epimerase
MRVLVTGHNGYIGSVLVPMLQAAGHAIVGLDTYFFEHCTFGDGGRDVEASRMDLRDVTLGHLAGFDAVIHLAALSNDPLGNLDPSTTYEINHRASIQLAGAAKAAGVPRFIFASSCSLYGVAQGGFLTEDAPFNPITPYGESKVRVEAELATLADDDFSPTYMRNATAYGVSPRLRADVVLNNLVGYAFTTGEIRIQSDGTPWRPLVHVEDFSRAFLAVLHADRDRIHNEAFNVGRTEENYRVSELAELVREALPGSTVVYAKGGGPDPRSYRVDSSKLEGTLPEYRPQWTAKLGVRQLCEAFAEHGLTTAEFLGPRYLRIKHITELLRSGQLDPSLRWRTAVATGRGAR